MVSLLAARDIPSRTHSGGWRTLRVAVHAAATALVACRASDATSLSPSVPSPRTARISTTTTSDTIGTRLTGALRVTVADGANVAALAPVTFRVTHNDVSPDPGVTLNATGDTLVSTRTSSAGTASVDVVLGKYSGSFAVVVTVQNVARPDTVTFNVLHGNIVSLHVGARDTLITVGAPYKAPVFASDRAGNPSPNPPTLTSSRSVCQVSGLTVTASDIARCIITVRAGAMVDSIAVSAVPKVAVTAVVTSGFTRTIATMNLDGSGLKLIRATNDGVLFDQIHPVLGPNGLIAAVEVGADGKAHVEIIDAAGVARLIPVDLPAGAEENWPVFSRDGQSLYFSACNWVIFEHCRIWQTKLDGSQPRILTPSTGSTGQRTNWTVQSFDGRMLLYAGSGERLHTLNLQTGADVDLGVRSNLFDIDSAGAKLVYLEEDGSINPMIIANIDGTNPRTVATGSYFYSTAQWLPGQQWILSRLVSFDASMLQHDGGRVLVNVTTGELVPLKLSSAVGEIYISR